MLIAAVAADTLYRQQIVRVFTKTLAFGASEHLNDIGHTVASRPGKCRRALYVPPPAHHSAWADQGKYHSYRTPFDGLRQNNSAAPAAGRSAPQQNRPWRLAYGAQYPADGRRFFLPVSAVTKPYQPDRRARWLRPADRLDRRDRFPDSTIRWCAGYQNAAQSAH